MLSSIIGLMALLGHTMAKQSMMDTWAEERARLLQERLPGEQYVEPYSPDTASPCTNCALKHTIKCMNNDGDQLATCYHISEGIDYLNGKGDARIDLNPTDCSRVSCSYGAQIQICNQGGSHNTTTLADIARNAQEIVDKCSTQYSDAPTCMTRGTIWDIGNTWDMQTYVGEGDC